MKKLVSLIIICLNIPFSVFAQESISIGNKYSMYSSVLDEERPYWVYLPPNYNNDEYGKANYPVIYLLDGDKNFNTLVAIQNTFTRGMYNNMPECIIVGIPNVDRTRDLTPSQSSLKGDGRERFTNSGGSEVFTRFLTQELRQQINTQYRTNGYNILIGHSFGGLFAISTLLHHTEAFNTYIALEPSLWWDNKKVFHEAENMWKTTNFSQRSLYVAMARDEDKPSSDQQHSKTIREFCTKILPSSPDGSINTWWKYFENEDHGSVIMPGMYDALRVIFEGIELPVKKIPSELTLIKEHYDALSSKLGFTFTPDETLIDNIGKYALSIDKINSAIKIFEYNLNNYPDSKHAQISLDNALRQEKMRK